MTRGTVLVVGATGSIGRHVVPVALQEGYAVRAFVRDPSRARLPAAADLVQGDLTQPDTIAPAVDGADAIVFVHGSTGGAAGSRDTFYAGVRNVLAALAGRTIPVSLMTAIAVTDRGRAHDWKRRAERLVRASGRTYTIVRPGWFDYNGSDEQLPVLLQGDTRQSGTPADGAIARSQIATILVSSLTSRSAARKTFELVSAAGPAPHDLDPLFAVLEPDRAGEADGVRDVAYMPAMDEPDRVRDDIKAIQAARNPRIAA